MDVSYIILIICYEKNRKNGIMTINRTRLWLNICDWSKFDENHKVLRYSALFFQITA